MVFMDLLSGLINLRWNMSNIQWRNTLSTFLQVYTSIIGANVPAVKAIKGSLRVSFYKATFACLDLIIASRYCRALFNNFFLRNSWLIDMLSLEFKSLHVTSVNIEYINSPTLILRDDLWTASCRSLRIESEWSIDMIRVKLWRSVMLFVNLLISLLAKLVLKRNLSILSVDKSPLVLLLPQLWAGWIAKVVLSTSAWSSCHTTTDTPCWILSWIR